MPVCNFSLHQIVAMLESGEWHYNCVRDGESGRLSCRSLPELRDHLVRGAEQEVAVEHVRVVLVPVLQPREIDRPGKGVGNVAEVLEQVLELTQLPHRGLHRHLPILPAVVHHRVTHGREDRPQLAGVVRQSALEVPPVGLSTSNIGWVSGARRGCCTRASTRNRTCPANAPRSRSADGAANIHRRHSRRCREERHGGLGRSNPR